MLSETFISEVEKLGSSRKTGQNEHFTIWLNPAEAVGDVGRVVEGHFIPSHPRKGCVCPPITVRTARSTTGAG